MRKAEGTEALVALEDAAPSVLFASIPGTDVPLWPMLRWPLGRTTQEIELGTVAVATAESRVQTLTRVAGRLLPDRFSSSRLRTASELLFVVDGGTTTQTPVGLGNWLVGDFVDSVSDRAVVLQDLPFTARTPAAERPAFPNTATFADALTRIEIAAYLKRPDEKFARSIREVVREAFRELPFDVDERRISSVEQSTIYRASRVKELNHRFARVLDRVQPRIAFVQSASYGNRSSLIALMKERGILVVEPQHGWIGPYHVAYNFGAAMWEPRLRAALPDVLLTFGQFWSDIVRTPSELVAIGKPNLEAMAAAARASTPKRREVLVISSVTGREAAIRFTLELRGALPTDWQVVFRPHPAERPSVRELYGQLFGHEGLTIDDQLDVSSSLASASAVFGSASTVLYEALAFGCRVFVMESPLADLSTDESTFGERIRDEATLASAIALIVSSVDSASAGVPRALLDRIWAPAPVEAFHRFVEERLARSPEAP